jgi:phosphatidylserine/phosphatidylglycerophosphate/cardiolipin synthase-like enzyme
MGIIRSGFLLCAGAAIFWGFTHKDQLQSGGHASAGPGAVTNVLAQAGSQLREALPTSTAGGVPYSSGQGREPIFFSPTQDLEHVDIGLIEQARSSIKIAMFAFTDRSIAEVLAREARSGVQIWIYRDRGQFEQEYAHRSQVSAILASQRNIHVRVKGSNQLMHEKAFLIDDSILRDGSGNWSVSARLQDNQITITRDASQIAAFNRNFRGMWDRGDNLVVQ